MLELQGHEVRVAASGRQALEEAAAQRFEVVLLDIGLPDIDGYRVARELQARCGSGVPVLAAVTGWGQPSDLQRSSEAGFTRHFTKPVDPYELEAFIEGLPG
jgi:CheY-like chemotaxis protein